MFDVNTNSIFAGVFDLYGLVDERGRVINLKGKIFQLTNIDPDLLEGQPFSETVFWQSSENTPRIIENAIEKAVAENESKILIDFRLNVDLKIPIQLYLQKLSDADGRTQIFVSGQQIAEKSWPGEHFREINSQLLSAAENAGIGLWFWDDIENRIYATPFCNELFELPAHQSSRYGAYISTVHPDDREFVSDFLVRSKEDGARYDQEFRVVYSGGEIEWLRVVGRSYKNKDGQPRRMIGVVSKITEQKRAAADLEQIYAREKKFRNEAVEANHAKDFFLAFVSHELRSPLNAILGWSRILLTKDVDSATQRTALESIDRSAKVQTKLIDDLVDSARVASGKLRLENRPANLCSIVKSSYDALKPMAEARNISYVFHSAFSEIIVFGDASRLQQVFGNLISNALKFTPENGRVSIEVTSGDSVASIYISDSGRGISSTELPNIFQQFSQGDAESVQANSGLGLGLSIVKILVTKHGGAVQAESDGVGKGSKFTVTLPLGTYEAPYVPAIVPQNAPSKPLSKLSIIIVEDDNDSREVLQTFLEQLGAAVISFPAVEPAMGYFTSQNMMKTALIISDIGMPDEDGYSFIRRVRALPFEKASSIPAIALSAFADDESSERAIKSGFSRFSHKPFEPDLLIADILTLTHRNDWLTGGE